MRNRYLVSYDISDPKRLARVFRKMRGFGEAVQYSVFLCSLSPQERVILLAALSELINHKEDRVMIVDLGPAGGRGQECMEFLGRSIPAPEARVAVIV
ncbi:MAG TPA: CRISPR-associated endonuclease Cas2 [Clostridiales bacterium]|nr:CRISPR-associated endonuclease Cas2 [Clostridiales bacterium]